ncbi:putative transcriptional regulatory protein [Xylariaceae sp. FL1651]|nr:putative transcriptional regulatory protein [Xylariaceae sp. FL1651]
MAPGDGESHQKPKRRKVIESCKVCRAKKTRCDGQRPVCSSCTARGVSCGYNEVAVPVAASTLLDIESRLRKLEQQAINTTAYAVDRNCQDISNESTRHSQSHLSNQDDTNPSICGLAPEAQVPFADHPTTQFIRDITQIADTRASRQFLQAPSWSEENTSPVEMDISSMVVPLKAAADDLVDCYERLVYPLFPVLHMPTFRENYERLWDAKRPGRLENQAAEATFHAALNIVFALGSINNSKIEPYLKLKTADSFYRRARRIMPLDALDSPSLGVVQYLLLATTYLNFTKYSHRCYNTLAVAIRVSQTLGLNMDVESSSNNQLKREMSRRVWYMCLTLERLISSIFGRKTMINTDSVVPLPAKIDDEYLREDGLGIQPADTPSILDAFIVSISIFEVIASAQKINYNSLTQGLRLPELTEVLQLNEKVDQIEKSLPSYLKYSSDAKPLTPRDQVLRLQAEGVMTRLLHLRLVLLRPNVLSAARQSLLNPVSKSCHLGTQSVLESTLRTEVSNICVHAAISTIDALHTNLRFNSRMISSIAVFMTLSAATIVIAASLVPELAVNLEDSTGPYTDAVAKAFQVLDGHMWQIEGAPRAKDLLEKFLETVNRENKRRKRENQQLGLLLLNEGEQTTCTDTVIDEFDFSDPLWTFQWDASAPLCDAYL